jgi:hypothetical protein
MSDVSVDKLMSLRAIVEADGVGGQDLVASYSRVRSEMIAAIDAEHRDEFDRLFPVELTTTGKPWKAQEAEVKTRFAQMERWLAGRVEAALAQKQIEAQAAKKVGFG